MSTPPFKKTCPCTIIPPLFLIFQIPSTFGGGNQYLLLPLKRGGANYVMQHIFLKAWFPYNWFTQFLWDNFCGNKYSKNYHTYLVKFISRDNLNNFSSKDAKKRCVKFMKEIKQGKQRQHNFWWNLKQLFWSEQFWKISKKSSVIEFSQW